MNSYSTLLIFILLIIFPIVLVLLAVPLPFVLIGIPIILALILWIERPSPASSATGDVPTETVDDNADKTFNSRTSTTEVSRTADRAIDGSDEIGSSVESRVEAGDRRADSVGDAGGEEESDPPMSGVEAESRTAAEAPENSNGTPEDTEPSATDADSERITRLVERLEGEDASERVEAARALGDLGVSDPEAVEPAMETLRYARIDTDDEVSKAACEAIIRIEGSD